MAVNKTADGMIMEKAEVTTPVRVGKCHAALLAAAIGILALAVVNLISEFSEGLKNALTLYKPIGPYSGKEAASTIVWLVSWAILNPILSRIKLETKSVLYVFLLIVALATLLLYPPFIHLVA